LKFKLKINHRKVILSSLRTARYNFYVTPKTKKQKAYCSILFLNLFRQLSI